MPNTIKDVLDGMQTKIENNEPMSPSWWLDESFKLAVLRQDLQTELVKAEIKYRNEVVALTNMDVSYNKAENMVKGRPLRETDTNGMTAYEYFNYLRTRDDVITEIIQIAKRRAITPI